MTVPRVAVTVAVEVADTPDVLIANVAVDAPPATVTEAGGVTVALVDVRFMTKPPVGAIPLRVTVPVDEFPPVRVVGFAVRLTSDGGLIVSVAGKDTEP